jgi:SAM-dependent methyltransferase
VKRELLNYVCCPACNGDLILHVDSGDAKEIDEGSFHCVKCPKSYEIRKGIPRFLPVELADEVRRNVDRFGYEWAWLSSTSAKNELEFKSYLGEIPLESLASRAVLDAGCGMGKFLALSGRYGAKVAIGVDLAEQSVENAYRNTRSLDNVHVVQADLYHLPLKGGFDFIYSIGVLHHLIKPETGFQRLVQLLREQGEIFAWVYGYEGNEIYVRFLDPFRRLTSRLPLSVNKFFTAILASLLWVLILLVYLPLDRAGIRKLPFHDYFIYFYRLGFRFFWGTVFDKAIPPISNYYRKEEFNAWFSRAGLSNVSIVHRNSNSWSGWGRKS